LCGLESLSLQQTVAVILLIGTTTGEGVFMLIEQQISERRARAGSAVVRVVERPAGSTYGDSVVSQRFTS
jgi:hypothetical protein